MKLSPLMIMHAELSTSLEIGAGPAGRRSIFNVTGGNFEGVRLQGTILSSGGDWPVVGADDVGRLDVRITLKTEDGAPYLRAVLWSASYEREDRKLSLKAASLNMATHTS